MIAAVLKEAGVLEIENNYPLRKLINGEVLLKVECCGVCGTDEHIYDGKAPSNLPVILGHEYSGTIADFAEDVTGFQIGDKVVIDPNIYCGYCSECRKGNIHFCNNHQALGVTRNGGFAEYSIVPASQVYKLPQDIDFSIASFAEPLSCCLRGIHHAGIKPSDSVIVVGGGSIGLIMIQLAKLAGASKIILIEPELNKQELGLKLGADFSISPIESNIAHFVYNYTNGGADVVIECAGKKEAVELSVNLTAKGGKVVIFGLAAKGEKITLDLQYLFRKEIQIHNSFLNPFTFSKAVDLITSNKIQFSSLVSKQVSLENFHDVFELNNKSFIIKQQVLTKSKE